MAGDKYLIIFCTFSCLCFVNLTKALAEQPIIRQLSSGLPYQYKQEADAQAHLVDLWESGSNMAEAFTYNPDTQNVYHLFTRKNPSVSQELVPGNDTLVWSSNFNATHRTAILIHGWKSSATANFNTVLVPAFLDAEDMNVIVVDWYAGAYTTNYFAVIRNTIASGEGVARFITWLNNATRADPTNYHIVGHSLGGQQAGVVGRNLGGRVDYITSVDPAGPPRWATNENRFNATDAKYTEVIHTNIGQSGYLEPLGDVDFYPNGGNNMPGCSNHDCDHDRAFYYIAESLRSGGFTGRRCNDYPAALIGNCSLPETLPMGGLTPKFGTQGVYYLQTNASPPFSQG